jgi:hypothetical protein
MDQGKQGGGRDHPRRRQQAPGRNDALSRIGARHSSDLMGGPMNYYFLMMVAMLVLVAAIRLLAL